MEGLPAGPGLLEAESGLGTGFVACIDLGKGNPVVPIRVVEGENEGDGVGGEFFAPIVRKAGRDLAAGEESVAVVIESVESLLEGDQFG